jgi:hypothetical protein
MQIVGGGAGGSAVFRKAAPTVISVDAEELRLGATDSPIRNPF